MTFPIDGHIKDTRWEKIARSCMPEIGCSDIDRVGQDFLNYLHFHKVSVHDFTVFNRFRYFCNNLAPRNHD